MLHTLQSTTQPGWLVRLDFPWYLRYGIAFVTVALALAITLQLPPIRTGTPFMFFFLAVAASALLGNFRAGVLAVLLSALTVGFWVMPPFGVFVDSQDEIIRILGFMFTATLISTLAYTINRSRRIIYEQSEWLRTTLASIGDAVIATDAAGEVVWMNAVAAELTGWQVEQAQGKPVEQIFQVFHADTQSPIESPVAQVLTERRVVGLARHIMLRSLDGTERPIEDNAAPIRDATGEISGAVLVFHDVSEGRAREVDLQSNRQRLQLALNAGRMVAWEWNLVNNQIWTTENFGDIYGIPSIEMVDQGAQLLHPDDLEHHQSIMREAAVQGGTYHLEFRIIRPDNGHVVWIEERGYAVPDATGQPSKRSIGISVDITERRAAEEEVRRLNGELNRRVQELQALFDLALVGIGVAIDPTCEMIIRNQTLAQWLGISKGLGPSLSHPDAASLPFRMQRNGRDVPAHTLPMQRAVAEAKSIVNQDYEIIRSDGSRFTVVVSATPIFDEEGRVTGCVSTFTDVSERKAAEITLRNMNRTLEQRVAERTAELEAINRELVEFTNVVSHDLRAPLRAITTLSQWVEEEAGEILPSRPKDHLAKMRQRVERMERLLSDLSAYTRAGRVHYQREQVHLAFLVKEIIDLLDTPMSFRTQVIEPMPTFVTERVPLETVLRNLIGNAYKHHHQPQEGHLTVAARDLGELMEVVVSDNGPGIAPEFQGRIFGVFQTLRPRDEVEGSGMGLAIAKRLVEGRGGQISVESRPGIGSTFRFTWPK